MAFSRVTVAIVLLLAHYTAAKSISAQSLEQTALFSNDTISSFYNYKKEQLEAQTVHRERRDNGHLSFQPGINKIHEITGVAYAHGEKISTQSYRIAILDSGVDIQHEALASSRIKAVQVDLVGDNFDGTNTPTPGSTTGDCHGRGTMLAGLIASDAALFKGVAPHARIMSYRVKGCRGHTTASVVANALDRAYNDGVDIVVLPLDIQPQPEFNGKLLINLVRLASSGITLISPVGQSSIMDIWDAIWPRMDKSFVTTLRSDYKLPIDIPIITVGSAEVLSNGAISAEKILRRPYRQWVGQSADIVAPGINVPVPKINSGNLYVKSSDPSIAAAYFAGMMAQLIKAKQAHRSSVEYLKSIFTSTATLINYSQAKESVVFQGAGFANLYNAIHNKCTLDTTAIFLGDNQARKPSPGSPQAKAVNILNNGNFDMQFHITFETSMSIKQYDIGGTPYSPARYIPKYSLVNIRPSTITIKKHGNAIVQVSIAEPSGLDTHLDSFYSGYIVFTPVSGPNMPSHPILRIPYMGLAGIDQRISESINKQLHSMQH